MSTQNILVIIPAYNESQNIKKTIDDVLRLEIPMDILVVDDGSSDETACEAAKTQAHVVSLPFNLGIGGAVQTGFKFAMENGYSFVVRVDGDGQHDAKFIAKLVDPVVNQSADIAIGSRFIKPFLGYRSSFVRRIGINFFSGLISFLTGTEVTDPTSGYRAYSKKAIEIFSEYYPHDFPEPETIMLANRSGLKLVEVPVEMKKRVAGNSSIRNLSTLYYMIKVTFVILLWLIKKKRVVES